MKKKKKKKKEDKRTIGEKQIDFKALYRSTNYNLQTDNATQN